MSDNATPDTGAQQGQQPAQVAQDQKPDAGAPQQAAQNQPDTGAKQVAEASEEPMISLPESAFRKRLREEMNKEAKSMGFKSWTQAERMIKAMREGDESEPEPKETAPAADSTATRLQMALQVGQELNLPVALISRLQGDDIEAMRADAEALQSLFTPQTPQGPGIRPVPQSEQQATFTKAQLQDYDFVKNNKDAIIQAKREGRIVDS